MESIRVLHIGMSPNIGGLESFVINAHRNVDANKVKFDFINIYHSPLAFEAEHKKLGSKVYSITARKENPLRSYKELETLIQCEKYDFVHFHCMTYCWPEPIIIGSKSEKTQTIVHSHLTGFNSSTSKKEKILHSIGKWRIRNKSFLRIACGEQAGKWLFPNKKYQIIENGIDLQKYKFNSNNRKKIRRYYGINDTDILIGHVGNFSYQKNYQLLIEIFYELYQKNRNYRLLLIGDERLAEKEKKIIHKLGLEKQVCFTGLIDNVNECYSAMDLFLFPSFYEGLSIAMVEAQTAGLPCFVSNKLDKKTNVGGRFYEIDIDTKAENIADYIINHYDGDDDRSNIEIDERYDCWQAGLKLQKFYEEHLLKG